MMIFNKIVIFSICLAFSAISQAETSTPDGVSFAQVYSILKTHCSACHVEGGAAAYSWTLNKPATEDSYAECIKVDTTDLCTTYLQLTGTEYPWMMAGNLEESPPYINACVPEQSYHIGVSIPERLSDQECDLIKNWILEGTKQ